MELPSIYLELIKKEIARFCRELSTTPAELYEPMKYMVSMKGKKIRPAVLLLSCKAFCGNVNDALPAALAVELFHNFTLMHDDIMDEAPLRRNMPSVHVKWNTNIALLSGDALVIKAYESLSNLTSQKRAAVVKLFTASALKVCAGQQLDMNFETERKVSVEDYLQMIGLKTAALFSASFQMGAMLGKAGSEEIERMRIFGENTGVLFQLQDDVLDVFGKQHQVGKLTGGDIIRKKKTFLLLKALELAKGNTRKELLSLLDSTSLSDTEKVGKVKDLYEQVDVLRHARILMEKYRDKARKAILPMKAKEIKILLDLPDHLLMREI